ncbi:MAG TPA: anion transporter, partial [Gammaproteobacteria bacterium]
SGTRFFEFMQAMLVPTFIAAGCLLLFTLLAFRPRPIVLQPVGGSIQVRWRLFALSACLFIPFIVAADLRHAGWALLAVALLYVAFYRPVLRRLDWPLLLVFLLMFVDLRLVAGLPAVAGWLVHLDLARAGNLYLAGAGLSQFISNVPTTILLYGYSPDWRALAWGVDMGGFGLVVGSLANLIALRLAGSRGSFLTFHAWAAPFLLLAGGLGYAWLVIHGGG